MILEELTTSSFILVTLSLVVGLYEELYLLLTEIYPGVEENQVSVARQLLDSIVKMGIKCFLATIV